MPDAPSPPAYIRFDKKQREQFLSQFGVTAPAQREMFQQLCDSWRPLIDFDSFTGTRTGVVSHPAAETENLMTRLKAVRLGIITTKRNERGERVPKDIVLCEESAPRYWFFFVQDLIQQACDNPRNPFLTLGLLKTREIVVPPETIVDHGLNQINKGLVEAAGKTEKLLFLLLQNEKVLATSQTLSLMLTFSSSKLRQQLKNPEVTAAASRLLNLSLTEVTKRLEDKESGFWRGLTEALLQAKEDLMADRRLHLDLGFFQAAELFYHYLTNQIEESKKLKERAAEREADLKQLEMLVLQDKDVVMPAEELESHMKLLFADKYGDQFEGLREEFKAGFLQTSQKTSIPVVLTLQAGLIHRNNTYKFFLKRFDSLYPILRQDYRIKMERRLRRPRGNNELDFLNKDNLERSLSEWTERTDPLVGELFSKPKVLAESMIHHGRSNDSMQSVEDMRPLLERFFKPGVMTLKTYQEIYGLDVPALYEEAFKNLSVFTQFWRRLNGSYRIQAEEFKALGLPREKKPEGRGTKSGMQLDDTPLDNLSPEELKKRKEDWMQRRDVESRTKPSGGRDDKKLTPAPVQKQYSDGERDKAWKGFRDTVQKKE
jgi:hypothetical protein